MGFDVSDLLGSLFGVGPVVAPVTAPAVAAVPVSSPDDGGRFADWVCRPDGSGRMGWESPGLPESDRWWARCDFDAQPEPGAGCPVCGSLESWQDLLGRERCGRCESDTLEKSAEISRTGGAGCGQDNSGVF